MTEFRKIQFITFYRLIARLLPFKRKLHFLIRNYLVVGKSLAIPYYKKWNICLHVNNQNISTVSTIILEGCQSQPEFALIKMLRDKLPNNMLMLDIGGNIGTFSCQFLDKCTDIYIYEPIPRLYQVISDSVNYNNCRKIHLVTKAVGDNKGVVEMLDNNNSSIVKDKTDADILSIEVTTLDNNFLDYEVIDFIKIDVEGYELHVLRGAIKVLEKFKPYLLIEVHPVYLENYNENIEDIFSILDSIGYKCSYYSYLLEQRLPNWKRILSRWNGNKGEEFETRESFVTDINKSPRLLSYHIFCEPR